ncbi:unnamed protein product, partial [Didymodactylos carnosus]
VLRREAPEQPVGGMDMRHRGVKALG